MGQSVRPATGQDFDLVAIDVDGTLLTSRHELSSGAEVAIRQARERGIEVTLISGRGKLPLMPWLERFKIAVPYVCSSGGFIVDPISGQVLFQGRLGSQDVDLIVGLARRHGATIFFDEPDLFLAEGDPQEVAGVARMTEMDVRRSADILKERPDPPTKIFLTGEHEVLRQIESRIREQRPALFLAYSQPTFLEITPDGADKGTAIRHLAAHLGIPLSRVAAIGDGANDIGMFRIVGLAVAMGNAVPEVKAEADVVAPPNDEGGVAWALEQVIVKG